MSFPCGVTDTMRKELGREPRSQRQACPGVKETAAAIRHHQFVDLQGSASENQLTATHVDECVVCRIGHIQAAAGHVHDADTTREAIANDQLRVQRHRSRIHIDRAVTGLTCRSKRAQVVRNRQYEAVHTQQHRVADPAAVGHCHHSGTPRSNTGRQVRRNDLPARQPHCPGSARLEPTQSPLCKVLTPPPTVNVPCEPESPPTSTAPTMFVRAQQIELSGAVATNSVIREFVMIRFHQSPTRLHRAGLHAHHHRAYGDATKFPPSNDSVPCEPILDPRTEKFATVCTWPLDNIHLAITVDPDGRGQCVRKEQLPADNTDQTVRIRVEPLRKARCQQQRSCCY